MKATYNKDAKTKFTRFHRKETKCFFDSYTAIVTDTGGETIKTPVELRLYGTGRTNTAAIWVNDHNNNIHTSGTGRAGGYGYHRPSAAAAEAIKNAGFELDKDINGVGNGAIRMAVQSIAEALGYKNVFILHSHP